MHYGEQKHRFFDSDPRTDEHTNNWKNTWDWFPYKKYSEINTVVWVECGYGHYAIVEGEQCVGVGKDVINTARFTFVGECASQDGKVYLAINQSAL